MVTRPGRGRKGDGVTALRRPALRDLDVYPVRQEGDELFIGIPS